MVTSRKNWLAGGVGVAGVLAAIVATTVTPAFGAASATSPAPIHSSRNNGPITLHNGDTTLVTLNLPAGKWLITGKMWADSVPGQSTTNTVVGCNIANGGTALDSSAFNTPKVGGAGGTAAGVNVLSAVITLKSTTTITFNCNDFGSQAVAHLVLLSAVG
jgi:hypothetical protein